MAVAKALPDDGKLVACDLSVEFALIGQRYWKEAGVANKIDLRIAPASDTLSQLIESGEENSFDFVFIDADKVSYDDYYEKSLVLLRQGGLILLDNMLQEGKVVDDSIVDENSVTAIREINKKLLSDERVDISLVPMSDGITLLRKR